MASARIIAPLLLIALLACTAPVAADDSQEAGFDRVNMTATADADGDGHISAGMLTIGLSQDCTGCSQSAESLTKQDTRAVIEVNATAGGSTRLRAAHYEDQRIHLNLATLVDFTETEQTNVTVTLYEQTPDSNERLASETLTVQVESPAADRVPNKTAAAPTTGLPATGITRTTDHFKFTYTGMEPCGLFCRKATGEIATTNGSSAENVSVRVRLRSGRTILWSGSERVGALTSNTTYTTSERINFRPSALEALSRNDGRVALVVAVRSDRWHEIVAFDRQLGG